MAQKSSEKRNGGKDKSTEDVAGTIEETDDAKLETLQNMPGFARVLERLNQAPNVSARMTSEGCGDITIGKENSAEECARLLVALGLGDNHMFSPLLGQIANAVSSGGEISEKALQFAVGFVKSVEPENETEALLAAQMAAVHVCAMDASRRYLNSTHLQGKDSAERALTKLTRTFATQMETLKRYRSKAQQVVRVERVTVNEGGQAIVGNVERGRGDGEK